MSERNAGIIDHSSGFQGRSVMNCRAYMRNILVIGKHFELQREEIVDLHSLTFVHFHGESNDDQEGQKTRVGSKIAHRRQS